MVFACKASRYITHMKKLKDPEQSIHRFFGTIAALGDKAGPVLFQLPPRWKADVEWLGRFLAALPEDRRYAFEFRDESWFRDDTYRMLSRKDAALCVYDLASRRSTAQITTDFPKKMFGNC